jgi:hypothetical protein
LALDYALRGVQVYATAFAIWMQMGLAYTRIREALLRAPGLVEGRLGKLRAAIERDWTIIVPVRAHEAEQRAWSGRFSQRMFERAQIGIRGLAKADRQIWLFCLHRRPGCSARTRRTRCAISSPPSKNRPLQLPMRRCFRRSQATSSIS